MAGRSGTPAEVADEAEATDARPTARTDAGDPFAAFKAAGQTQGGDVKDVGTHMTLRKRKRLRKQKVLNMRKEARWVRRQTSTKVEENSAARWTVFVVLKRFPALLLAVAGLAGLTVFPVLAQQWMEHCRPVYGEVVVCGSTSLTLLAFLRFDVIGRLTATVARVLPRVLAFLGLPPWTSRTLGEGLVRLYARIFSAMYIFLAFNTTCDAIIPDNCVVQIPDAASFLFAQPEYTGKDFEGVFLGLTGRILKAYVAVSTGLFVQGLKAIETTSSEARSVKPAELKESDGIIKRYVMALRGDLNGTKHSQWVGLALLVNRMVDCIIVFACMSQVLAIFGVELKSLLAVAGVATFALSLSARPLVQNLIAGLSIFLLTPFTKGDLIKSSEGITGHVERIGWVNTQIRTSAGVEIVPNSFLMDKTLLNKSRLPDLHLDVSTDSLYLVPLDPGSLHLPTAMRSITRELRKNPKCFDGQAFFKGTTASGLLQIDVNFSVESVNADSRMTKRAEVLAAVYETARQSGLTSPTSP